MRKNTDLGMRYITDTVVPALDEVLKNLLYKIENRHRLEEYEGGKKDSSHSLYEYFDTLVSMLQNASVERRTAKLGFYDELNSLLMNLVDSVEGRSASLRLYDSTHFNDPDEGKYFYRNLKPRKQNKNC